MEYHRVLRKVVKVQSRVRRWLAIKELKRLKVGGGLWVEVCRWGIGGRSYVGGALVGRME